MITPSSDPMAAPGALKSASGAAAPPAGPDALLGAADLFSALLALAAGEPAPAAPAPPPGEGDEQAPGPETGTGLEAVTLLVQELQPPPAPTPGGEAAALLGETPGGEAVTAAPALPLDAAALPLTDPASATTPLPAGLPPADMPAAPPSGEQAALGAVAAGIAASPAAQAPASGPAGEAAADPAFPQELAQAGLPTEAEGEGGEEPAGGPSKAGEAPTKSADGASKPAENGGPKPADQAAPATPGEPGGRRSVEDLAAGKEAPNAGAPNGAEQRAGHGIGSTLSSLLQAAGSPRDVAAPATPSGPGGPALAAVPLAAVAVELARQAREGNTRFDIRLDPPELGRIEVTLDIGKDGATKAHLVVERTETLDLLMRDAKTLERALQGAGLKTDEAPSFSLKDHGSGKDQAPGERRDEAPRHRAGRDDEPASESGDRPGAVQAMRAAASLRIAGARPLDLRI